VNAFGRTWGLSSAGFEAGYNMDVPVTAMSLRL